MTGQVLLDNSAWARLGHPRLPQASRDEVAAAVERGAVFACLPFLLEAGYSARDARDHAELLERLGALARAPIDEGVEEKALDAQARLALVGHHRIPPVDVLMSAIADRHGLGILHYDADYDLIRAKTDLRFESCWMAPRGSL